MLTNDQAADLVKTLLVKAKKRGSEKKKKKKKGFLVMCRFASFRMKGIGIPIFTK